VNPTVPVVPEATASEREFGKPEETGVLDLTTEILDAELRAAQASSASVVPVKGSILSREIMEMRRIGMKERTGSFELEGSVTEH
jgi:hypothetical protein